jgi:Xaa-Pro aminopeptidase
MRLYKSAAEIRALQRACDISAAGHCRAMAACRPGMMEYELEAELLYEFTRQGARHPAYPSIVGGGRNACILHYIDNNASLRDGDLVLIDAGCEWAGYAADITRTFPANGVFSPAQKQLYELVLAVQLAAIAALQPGAHWNEAHEVSVRVMVEGLVQLGILQGAVDRLIASGAYKAYYMHRIGHWLGMDVHDVGDYRVGDQWRVLESGMVLTVEPGLYIRPDDERVPKKWRGLAIRIEDDVVITRTGCHVLSAAVPKTCADIEQLMARGRQTGPQRQLM